MMVNIHDIPSRVKSLLSSLKYSQYKDFVEQWRGKKQFRTLADTKEKKDFVKQYVDNKIENAYTELLEETSFIDSFNEDVAQDTHLAEKIDEELHNNIEHFMEKAYKDDWLGTKDSESFEEFCTEENARFVIDCIVSNKFFTMTDTYKEYIEDKKKELRQQVEDMKDEFISEASREYEQEQGYDTANYLKENVSVVYEDLFNNLKSQNSLNTTYRLYYDIDITTKDIMLSKAKNMTDNKTKDVVVLIPNVIAKYFDLLNKNESRLISIDREETDRLNVYEEILHNSYHDPVQKRDIPIGRMFELVKKKSSDFYVRGFSINDLQTLFNQRSLPFKGKFVICRHPYDIAGMSTDRRWTSCTDLINGAFKKVVGPTIMRCGLIAYLIKEDDIKITNPISRILLKAYVNGDMMDYENPNWLLKTSDIYGIVYEKFGNAVQKWADENWNSNIEENISGDFVLHDDFYNEVNDSSSVSVPATKK